MNSCAAELKNLNVRGLVENTANQIGIQVLSKD